MASKSKDKTWKVALRNPGVTYTAQYPSGCNKYEANVHEVSADSFELSGSSVVFFDADKNKVAIFANVESVLLKKT